MLPAPDPGGANLTAAQATQLRQQYCAHPNHLGLYPLLLMHLQQLLRSSAVPARRQLLQLLPKGLKVRCLTVAGPCLRGWALPWKLHCAGTHCWDHAAGAWLGCMPVCVCVCAAAWWPLHAGLLAPWSGLALIGDLLPRGRCISDCISRHACICCTCCGAAASRN
jgi:hypothetical protein